MIKRFCFVDRRSNVSIEEFAAAWPEAVARVQNGPADIRPLRAVACTTLQHVEAAPHDGLSIEWFASVNALRRFEKWLDDDSPLVDAQTVLLAEERVLRGEQWLTKRWASGSVKLKHMALARRAHGLTAAEFSERWRNHAGSVGATPIPEAAKGHAYVQNYAAVEQGGRYDAVNEVYFDDLDAMQSRVAFFRSLDAPRSSADLVSEATFLAVVERVI